MKKHGLENLMATRK